MNKISLSDNVSENFKLSEAIYLKECKIYAFPNEQILNNIIKTANLMEKIRWTLADRPIFITSWWRPEFYNELIKGSKNSAHLTAIGVDFTVEGLSANQVRNLLKPILATLNIRMENLPDSPWTHIDLKPVENDSKRLFIP